MKSDQWWASIHACLCTSASGELGVLGVQIGECRWGGGPSDPGQHQLSFSPLCSGSGRGAPNQSGQCPAGSQSTAGHIAHVCHYTKNLLIITMWNLQPKMYYLLWFMDLAFVTSVALRRARGMHVVCGIIHALLWHHSNNPVMLRSLSSSLSRLSVHFSGGFTRRTSRHLALTSSTCSWGLTRQSRGWRCVRGRSALKRHEVKMERVWLLFCVHACSSFVFEQDLMERLDSLLCGDGSESLKSLCLKLLLCLVTVRLNTYGNSSMN